jgi:thiosulfate dehydrogenase
MKNLLCVGTAAATFVLYVGVIAFGARLGMEGLALSGRPVSKSTLWHVEPLNVGGSAARLETIQFGSQLFNETPIYGSTYVKSRISCSNCHLQGGTAPYASPVVGIVPSFPMFSKRAGRKITLEDRIQECMTRSENGKPLPSDSHEMKALLAYINWLSEPHIGVDGEGTRRPFPPLWGPNSFNDGAGMNGIEKMAAFVQYNMPHNRKGILSTQDAFDVAAYVHDRPRPAFNPAYDHF